MPDSFDKNEEDAPLVGTLRFVFVMGISFALLWLGMYLLLRGALVDARSPLRALVADLRHRDARHVLAPDPLAAFADKINPPSGMLQVDPTRVAQTPPFDNPGCANWPDGTYEAYYVAQVFSFSPEHSRAAGQQGDVLRHEPRRRPRLLHPVYGREHDGGSGLGQLGGPHVRDPGEYLLGLQRVLRFGHQDMFAKIEVRNARRRTDSRRKPRLDRARLYVNGAIASAPSSACCRASRAPPVCTTPRRGSTTTAILTMHGILMALVLHVLHHRALAVRDLPGDSARATTGMGWIGWG